jgi:predicted Zn-dependent protease
MKRNFLFILILFLNANTMIGQKKTNHDLTCYANSLDVFEEVENELFTVFSTNEKVTIAEELEVGEVVYEKMKEKHTIRTSGSDYDRVSEIMNALIKQISTFANPTSNENFSKYKPHYKIYIIESNEINAFTAGARIFVTTGIYNFCKSKDELACIIGHEICHNELGHIAEKIKKYKIASGYLGDELGAIANNIGSFLTQPFNQKNEGHCDLFGLDLARAAGYDACQNIQLWSRMSENNGEKDIFSIFSSHPYSGDRATCSKNHLKKNYNMNCNN